MNKLFTRLAYFFFFKKAYLCWSFTCRQGKVTWTLTSFCKKYYEGFHMLPKFKTGFENVGTSLLTLHKNNFVTLITETVLTWGHQNTFLFCSTFLKQVNNFTKSIFIGPNYRNDCYILFHKWKCFSNFTYLFIYDSVTVPSSYSLQHTA